MLTLQIDVNDYDRYTIQYIEYLKGYGKWQYPLDNHFKDGLSREDAEFVTRQILKTLDSCMKKINNK